MRNLVLLLSSYIMLMSISCHFWDCKVLLVQTGYERCSCKQQRCAWDPLSQDWNETHDPCLWDRDETETFKILSEMRLRLRFCSFEMLAKTLKLPRLESQELQRFVEMLFELHDKTHWKWQNFMDQLTSTMVSTFYLWYCGFLSVAEIGLVILPAQNILMRHNGPRPEMRPTGPRLRHIVPRLRRDPRCIGQRRDRDVEDFVWDKIETRR